MARISLKRGARYNAPFALAPLMYLLKRCIHFALLQREELVELHPIDA